MSPLWVVAASLIYLLLLVTVAHRGDRLAARGRSLIANPWTYALSMAVYCSAWTYFGSVGRAATAGVWFLPIYLGPTLAMVLGWLVWRKVLRIAKTYRITSIADFIGSRYGNSPWLAAWVTLIALVGVIPYIALQLKAISAGYALLTTGHASTTAAHWSRDSTFYIALALAGFTMVFGARHLDNTERHEGLVAAIAFESLVKLAAFVAVGVFVVYGVFDGLQDLFARAQAVPDVARLLRLEQDTPFAWSQWFALLLLSMLSLLLLPRQFQVMVVENVHESHLRRAAWVFPLYLLLINLFVLPLAVGGLLHFGSAQGAENFVISLPLAAGQPALALLVFIGGLSAATGMVIVEAIAVSTMVCNTLVLPWLLRGERWHQGDGAGLARVLLGMRRATMLVLLLLGYAYFHVAGEAYALVSIGLISFAAVAQFAPALLGGLYWKGGTQRGALWGLLAGFGVWGYTLMLPSIARSGWVDDSFIRAGPWGVALLRPEQLLGLQGLDNLTHALFWSLLVNTGVFVGLSLRRPPSGVEASQAQLFVDIFQRSDSHGPVFWRGRVRIADLRRLCQRFLGTDLPPGMGDTTGTAWTTSADARWVWWVETQLAGVVGTASARALVASVADEVPLSPADVLRIVDESTRLREANEQLKSLDRLKDDFMSSVTHELRTPLTSIRALAELMHDDVDMAAPQRQQFMSIIVSETERLSRLVNQVLDMAKIESGHAQWHSSRVDLSALAKQAATTTAELFRERQCRLTLELPDDVPVLLADADRLTQVLLNLLSNAAKFVPVPGGQVVLRLVADDHNLTVCVHDNGPGVPPEQHALIFEKFRQGGDTAHRPQGTGLGLPISRQIIEHFGGRLWLETGSSGACFCFSLPLPHTPVEGAES